MPDESKAKCSSCLQVKPKSDFHKFLKRKCGVQPRCKACSSLRDKTRDRVRARIRERKEYMLSYMKENRVKFPHKWKARLLARKAYQTGLIKKQPCVFCGSAETEMHHEDYSKPIDVVWLCHPHHMKLEHGHLKLPTIH